MQDQRIPLGYCQCGCGAKTGLASKTSARNGWVKGQPLRFVRNHNRTGARLGPEYIVEDRGHKTPCWTWQRLKAKDGYGRVWSSGAVKLAHRIYYESEQGPVPEGYELDHLCRNRGCVNPTHLEVVSSAENVRRGQKTKLTPEDIEAIRASKESNRELGRRFGIHRAHVSKIRSGRRWSSTPGAR